MTDSFADLFRDERLLFPKKYLIIAPNYRKFDLFCFQHNLDPRDWKNVVYASNVETLTGRNPFDWELIITGYPFNPKLTAPLIREVELWQSRKKNPA
jgi:hypothetical protein